MRRTEVSLAIIYLSVPGPGIRETLSLASGSPSVRSSVRLFVCGRKDIYSPPEPVLRIPYLDKASDRDSEKSFPGALRTAFRNGLVSDKCAFVNGNSVRLYYRYGSVFLRMFVCPKFAHGKDTMLSVRHYKCSLNEYRHIKKISRTKTLKISKNTCMDLIFYFKIACDINWKWVSREFCDE